MSKNEKNRSGRALPFVLKMSPMAEGLATGPVSLPDVKAPSLAGLVVKVPAREDLTQDDLLRRFHELKRQHSQTRDRKAGEPIALGDDVQLDTLGYSGGKLIPFSVRMGLWMELAAQEALPGFAEAIALGSVGDNLEVNVELPADYPVEWMRGQSARFLVTIKAARAVTEAADDDAAILKALGRGKTLDEVLDSIREELEDRLADELTLEGQDLVLDEVVSRARVSVPSSLVDEEIRRRWAHAEGKTLADLGFDADEQREAMQGWLADPSTRADAERRLKIALVLKAIASRDHLELTKAKLEEYAALAGDAFGLSTKDVTAGLHESKDLTSQMAQTAWHLMAVEHVMSSATLSFDGA